MKIINEKGITLISLVVTIIILIILAGVTISVVTDSGLIDETSNVTNEYVEKSNEEENIIDNSAAVLNSLLR